MAGIISNWQAPVQFCEHCKNLLLDNPKCGRCGTENQLKEMEMMVEKKYAGAKAWSLKLVKVQKASMKMDCPHCGAKKMYYTSRQLRSADEGETVFLECQTCGYKTVV